MSKDKELARKMIAKYTEAELAVIDGKSVSMNGRTLTLENLQEIRKGRAEWERRLNRTAQRLPYKRARLW